MDKLLTDDIGTLRIGEKHPNAFTAMEYIKEFLSTSNPFIFQESLASSALSGNRTAEICSETLRRILNKEPVSDRYLMGLAWFIYAYTRKDE